MEKGWTALFRGWLQYRLDYATPLFCRTRILFLSTAINLFPAGSIGHCGHTGQSVFVDLKSGLYVIILSDATIAIVKKYGNQHYEEVMRMRQDIHNAIKADLQWTGYTGG